jgi:hypothetical protein
VRERTASTRAPPSPTRVARSPRACVVAHRFDASPCFPLFAASASRRAARARDRRADTRGGGGERGGKSPRKYFCKMVDIAKTRD